jgi:hypothetical protein
MENTFPLSVPIKVELKIGQNWGEMKVVDWQNKLLVQ